AQQHGQGRFLQSHDLLHQDAVDEFVQPIFVVEEGKDVFLGGSSRRRRETNAARINAAKLLQKVADGFVRTSGLRSGASFRRNRSGGVGYCNGAGCWGGKTIRRANESRESGTQSTRGSGVFP